MINLAIKFEIGLLLIDMLKALLVMGIKLGERFLSSHGWDNKSSYLNIIEFLSSLAKLAILLYKYYLLAIQNTFYLLYFFDHTYSLIANILTSFKQFITIRQFIKNIEALPEAT